MLSGVPDSWLHSSTASPDADMLDYCSRKLEEGQRPSHLEVLLPPFLFLLIAVTGMGIHYILNQLHVRRAHSSGRAYMATAVMVNLPAAPYGVPIKKDNSFPSTTIGSHSFFTEFDLEVQQAMQQGFNTPYQLLKLCIPTAASILLSGILLFTKDHFFRCMWPGQPAPSINVAVTCFLAPAGLIYALSFGFTFQFALEKSGSVLNKITTELSEIDQMATLVTKLSLPSKKYDMALYEAIKSEVISMGMLIQNREPRSYRANTKGYNVKVHLWRMIDVLRTAATHPEFTFSMNRILVERLVAYLLRLNNICSDRIGILHSSIHPLKWVFLELLGTMTLLGVLMIDAKSSRLETALCELTAFSMAMLCYVLADLDSPFHGFFRVDKEVLPDVLLRLEGLYSKAQREWQCASDQGVGTKYTEAKFITTGLLPPVVI